ncbi:hypothetical protein AX16_001291 [Volvariella volvacea WC 439]|nr:hypothetical protein AX16_001291 [Volvariella volvacea WC 439]
MSSPESIARLKQLKDTEPLQEAWDEWTKNRKLLDETAPLLNDPDVTMRTMATEEFQSLTHFLTETLNNTFPSLLVPPSTTSQLSALMELKSGVGGSEASLFLSDLLRMYLRQANINRWKTEVVASNETEGGGTKDAIVEIKGDGVYDALRWESGVHRVQRVPATDASGRVHTSTVAVVVLPLEDENKRNNDDDLFSMDDVKVEVMRARGAGGQHVNKTESAVRLTHIPTGITVSMQDERSQHQNKRRAFQVLRARLLDRKITQDIAQRRDTRRNLVRTADRSEKIRTYNFAQDRVTDHRIGLTLTNLTSILEGDGLGEILDALKRDYDESVLEDMLNSD